MATDSDGQDGTCLAGNENETYLSAIHSWETRIRSEHFLPIQEKLLSALALSQSQQLAFEGVTSFARMFGVQLLSDALSVKVTDLLSKPQPEIVEADISYEEDEILWTDVIGELQFEPQRQQNGNYLCRVQKRNALIEMSAWDHDLISTRRKLVHTQAYLSDMLAERDTLGLMMGSLSSCNEIALRCQDATFSLH
ncbi:hypothetical protein F1880_010296 [Penicillium rolfsii]|nr:hypothetical protein F1880_010296 [Penicillium rolfsii]